MNLKFPTLSLVVTKISLNFAPSFYSIRFKVTLWARSGELFLCPFTTRPNPIPLLCRNTFPLSQQLRQESG
jgi:hypothetical protein